MEIEEGINNNCYYKNTPDNDFNNRYTYGLNFEGIKRYYTVPENNKYKHLAKLNKDLEIRIEEDRKVYNERQEKLASIDRYNKDRLIKMYTRQKTSSNETLEKNKNNSEIIQNLFTEGNGTNKNVNVSKNITKKSEDFIKRKEEGKTNKDNPIKLQIDKNCEKNLLKSTRNISNDRGNFLSFKNLLPNQRKNNKNIYRGYSPNTFGNKSLDRYYPKMYSIKNKDFIQQKNKLNLKANSLSKLPKIRPRKIIIDYCQYNGSNVISKKIGCNSNFMGSDFNPANYSIPSKNRTARNVFGGLYLH